MDDEPRLGHFYVDAEDALEIDFSRVASAKCLLHGVEYRTQARPKVEALRHAPRKSFRPLPQALACLAVGFRTGHQDSGHFLGLRRLEARVGRDADDSVEEQG